jgi:hypothetical protein
MMAGGVDYVFMPFEERKAILEVRPDDLLGKTRQFGGERFNYQGSVKMMIGASDAKLPPEAWMQQQARAQAQRTALKTAAWWRSQGYNARVVPTARGWAIYTRSMRHSGRR